MSQPAMKGSAARQGWSYLGKLAITAFTILFCLVLLKFFTEHMLAPKNFGIGGALSQPRLDLLLMGSSHTRKSYEMNRLEEITGITAAFQISYDGTDLNAISEMVDHLVANPEHCPRYLVVEAYGAFLTRRPEIEDPRYFADAPPGLKLTVIRSYLSAHRSPSAFLDLFDLVANRGNDEIVSYPFYSHVVNRDSYKGGRMGFAYPGLSPEEFRKLRSQLDKDTPNPTQLAALYHILDVAHSHNIAVIFIDPPMPQPVTSNPYLQILKKDFREILSARKIPYIDGDQGFPIDDPSMFSDSNHLSSKGRDEFTRRIGGELKSWIDSKSGAGE